MKQPTIIFISLILFLLGCGKEDTPAPELPVLSTQQVSKVTSTSADVGGNITSVGLPTYTERGICIGSSPTPIGKTAISGSGSGMFSTTISGLTPNTQYYVRAYAVNAAGTAYGNEVSFTTKEVENPEEPEPEPTPNEDMLKMFPDPVFREILKPYDINKDGLLSPAELKNINSLVVVDKILCSLEGVQHLKNLKWISIRRTEITSVDLSSNVNLESIKFVFNPRMTFAKLPESKGLEDITFDNCDLDTLIVQAAPSLKTAYISGNPRLKAFDTTKCPNLITLQSFDTSIEIQDFSTHSGEPMVNLLMNDNLKYLILKEGLEIGFISSGSNTKRIELTSGEVCVINIADQGREGADIRSYIATIDQNITTRGICWNTSPEPTINDHKIEGDAGVGDFIKKITTFSLGSKYYIRSYAQTGSSIVYSNESIIDRLDYTQDGIVTRLQSAKKGKGINLILMGDGFTHQDIINGGYKKEMNKAMDAFFALEPAKSLRDYFNCYMVTTVSASNNFEEGGTALGVCFSYRTYIGGDFLKVIEYAQKTGVDLTQAVVSITAKAYDNRLGGTCHYLSTGLSVAYTHCAEEEMFKNTLRHEALGHGFAHLADEYGGWGTIDKNYVEEMRIQQGKGWWANIDFTNDPNKIGWKQFLDDPKYSYVGVYEGGGTYDHGVWRPEENSCMGDSSFPYFNAPSRYAIYCRVMQLAGEPYSFEAFKAFDNVTPPKGLRAAPSRDYIRNHQSPVFIDLNK
ncbi:M64 family metallopeptidase [Parabacteroides sp. PF5-9]|uniref:M64 family metallopeptidase n=1 Tax=Parabacteroides sp. PF5-9 TaxID=1742404 RepID=UPI002473E1AB|nr:M64 family metallopeptidase [Parabacteroides sp. PF5-9]MDH6357835.1 hypothetical protein [Parabacteroides sp. PF5-9]